jgi:hypothetical protein
MIQQFGRYIIKSKLGCGAWRLVYQAHDLDERRSHKVLPPAMLTMLFFGTLRTRSSSHRFGI